MRRRHHVEFLLPPSPAEWAGQALADVFPDGLLCAPAGRLSKLSGWTRKTFTPPQLNSLRARLTALGAARLRLRLQSPPRWDARVRTRYPVQKLGRFWIVPQWKRRSVRVPKGRQAIYLLQGQAFGTGLHESTRLMLKGIGRSVDGAVLDVGAGSGVLGFACLRSGSSKVTAVEVEEAACAEMRLNRSANRVPAARFAVHQGAFPLRTLRTRHPLVLANLVTPLLERLMPALRARLRPGGRLLCSGIHRDAEARRVAAAARKAGLRPAGRAALGAWRRLDFVRP